MRLATGSFPLIAWSLASIGYSSLLALNAGFVTATTRNLSPARHAVSGVEGKSASVDRFGFGFLAGTGRPIAFRRGRRMMRWSGSLSSEVEGGVKDFGV